MSSLERKNSICFVVATGATIEAFLIDHINLLSKDYRVYIAGNLSTHETNIKNLPISGYKRIFIRRNINIITDIISTIQLSRYFMKMKFDAVHSITPKAGLINAIAGRLAGVRFRIHIFTGQVWHTKSGLFRKMLMLMDKIIVKYNTHILVDGESQRQYLISNKIITNENSFVLGNGSISGVNINRFTPSPNIRLRYRKELGFKPETIVYTFLGRLNIDKGIKDLLEVYNILCLEKNNVYLLFIGYDEENMIDEIIKYPNIKPGVNFTYFGPTNKPEEMLQASDVFCLPSYREGFGTSVIEASCLGLPVICSDTYGLMDAMIDNVTGLRHKVKSPESLYIQMKRLALDPELRKFLGSNGRRTVLKNWSSDIISNKWLEFYNKLLAR